MVGKYELGERIGGGGMADVFRAEVRGAEGFSRSVAIKRIKRNISTDKGFAELFINEARLAARLAHPNIVQTIDFDRDETGCFYLVMELIEGVDLRELVRTGRIPVSAVVFLLSEVLRALDYAHEMVADGHPLTIVHRDISPHNIMLGWQGSVKVVDFGIAKAIEGSLVSQSGSLKGKVGYMSPEQVHGQELDGRSDLFAVGIIFHELLTGQRLFAAESEAATLSQLLTKPVPPPSAVHDDLPKDLDEVVMTLLQRDRDQRYARARDALDALLTCSTSTVQGRSDLEVVLAERFESRAPRRVQRLSRSPGESGPMLGAVETKATPAGDLSASATAETVAAMPPKTFTLAAESPKEESAESEYDPARRSRLPWIATAVILAAGLGGVTLLGGDKLESPEEPGLELVAVEPSATWPDAAQPFAQSAVADAVMADASPVELEPERATKKAELTLRVKPWATIKIDGKDYGQTPQTITLQGGKHRIVLENVGLDRKESFSLRLKPGQSKVVDKAWSVVPASY